MKRKLVDFKKFSAVVAASFVIQLGLCSVALGQAAGTEDKALLQSGSLDATASKSDATFGHTAPVAQAQTVGGCDDSPENPTLVLAVLAGAVFWIVSYRRNRKIVEG